jgi:hypothetical protein
MIGDRDHDAVGLPIGRPDADSASEGGMLMDVEQQDRTPSQI